MRGVAFVFIGLAVLLLIGASSGCSEKTAAGGGKMPAEGSIILNINGAEVHVKVRQMDIFLVDPDAQSTHAESFIVWEEKNLELVGKFPLDIHVGYEEKMDLLIGKSIDIDKDGDPGNEGFTESHIKLPHRGVVKVSSGALTVTRVLGQNPKGAGKIIEGTITLELEDKTEIKGTFVFLAVTYG